MRQFVIVCAIFGMAPCLMAESAKKAKPSPKDKLVKWIRGHHIPEVIDVKNVKSRVPNRYILGDPAIKRNTVEFMSWMGIQKEKIRVDVGVNGALLRSLDITNEHTLILHMNPLGDADERFVISGIVMRKVADRQLEKILWGLMSTSSTDWKEASPKEGEQNAVE